MDVMPHKYSTWTTPDWMRAECVKSVTVESFGLHNAISHEEVAYLVRRLPGIRVDHLHQ